VTSDASLHSVFTSTYGSLSVGVGSLGTAASFTAGVYSFTRVHDNSAGASSAADLHATLASTFGSDAVTDNLFMDGSASVKFTVKNAGNSNTFGWANTASTVNGGNFSSILSDTTPGATATVPGLSSSFQFALNSSGTYWGSNAPSNSDTRDHLLTWFVQGDGRNFFVVAWDDLANGGDGDFNDWIGEVQVVPLPTAAWAGISSLAGAASLGVIRRRRLRQA
jgi:hypothetical protein